MGARRVRRSRPTMMSRATKDCRKHSSRSMATLVRVRARVRVRVGVRVRVRVAAEGLRPACSLA